MLALLVGYCALFGLVVGSFLNVVIYRVPRKESMVSPRSACPTCEYPIGTEGQRPDLLLALPARDGAGTVTPPSRCAIPLVEAATAGLFAGVAARIGFSWSLPAYLVLAAGLLALGLHRHGAPVAARSGSSTRSSVLSASSWSWPPAITRTLAQPPRGRDQRHRLVRHLLHHELHQPAPARLRRCPTRAGPRIGARLARGALRPARLLRRQPHRRHHRDRHSSPPSG